MRAAAALAALALVSCGYHVGGRADLVPKSVETISIPAFGSTSTRYKLVDALPQEIAREFTARTRFRIVNDPSLADAVLTGAINSVGIYPTVADPSTGNATSVRVAVSLTLRLTERTTGKVLYSRPNWAFHQDYAQAVNAHQFFDESGPAFDRLSREVAHDVVSAVVENF
ncbi:MAG TPA: LptE family protein [Bryobacteraceae bacterium]|jgi:hypothetical protein